MHSGAGSQLAPVRSRPESGIGRLFGRHWRHHQHQPVRRTRFFHIQRTELIIVQYSLDRSWLRSNLDRVPFPPPPFDLQVGVGAFGSSTLLAKLKVNPNDPTIRDEFMRWVYAGGVILQGLVNRRTAEANLYFS